jgi:hypothetical protein
MVDAPINLLSEDDLEVLNASKGSLLLNWNYNFSKAITKPTGRLMGVITGAKSEYLFTIAATCIDETVPLVRSQFFVKQEIYMCVFMASLDGKLNNSSVFRRVKLHLN